MIFFRFYLSFFWLFHVVRTLRRYVKTRAEVIYVSSDKMLSSF